MKKFIFSFTIIVLIVSCSDNSLDSIQIDRDEIRMHYDEDEQLGITYHPSDADETPLVTWFSENTNVAEISANGLVEGAHVGETRILAQTEDGSFQDYCDVIIEPRSNLYATPCLELGCSKTDIKAFEQRDFLVETDDALMYYGDNSDVEGLMYLFESEKLNAAFVMLEESDNIVDKLVLYLEERYEYLGSDGDIFIFSVNSDVAAIIGVTYEMGLTVTYLEDVRNKSIKTSDTELTLEQKEILKYLHKTLD